MKKKIFFALFVVMITNVFAQVGINEIDPKVTLDVKSNAQNTSVLDGFRTPRISGDELKAKTYTADHDGAIVYVTSPASIPNQVDQTIDVKNKGYYYYDNDAVPGGKWIRWIVQSSLQKSPISVVANTLSGSYKGGVPLDNSNTVSFTVTNNSFQSISNIDFSNDVGVINGTSAISIDGSANSSVSLNPGASKILIYKLTGTPVAGDLTANFDKTLGNLHADISTVVGSGSATIQNKDKYVVSLTYTPSSGGNTVDIQGKINNTTNVVTISIPYTSGQGSYSAISQTQTSSAGEGGDVNDLTLTIPAGNFSNNGVIPATITVGGDSEYLVKKMAPGQEYIIATYNITMNSTSYTVRVIGVGGIPDRRFGDGSNHDFLYLPVVAEDGKIWLNNNLGSDYANLNHSSFNPSQQATSPNDHHAYGSLYQWGRYSDGHELITWNSTSSGTPVGVATVRVSYSDTVGHDKFLINPITDFDNPNENYPYDWRSPQNDNLWQGVNGINNPCPTGYRIPTAAEFMKLKNLGYASLAISYAGSRDGTSGEIQNTRSQAYIWTNTKKEVLMSYISIWRINTPSVYFHHPASGRYYGKSVRCIKD